MNDKQMNTYIGNKGYTLLKKELTDQQQITLKNELTAKPFTQGGMGMQESITYPVYRESANKFYIPRFYGERVYGPAKEMKISDGEAIDIPFTGSLRENQLPVVETYMKHIQTGGGGGGGLIELFCGGGKTTISLYLSSQIKKKTLIIVHKEFLMNQWIERIHQFLPTARVGKIQGQIIDIENKDIVIGMLQSLSMKDYPDTMFESFGLTIIDEVHHISSQVFSCALFKIVTRYMLGLSATMERKDGTTKIFKMFLGDVVYKGTRDDKHPVIVRAMEYISGDEEFNEIKYDYRGNVMHSTMISKLCSFNHRSEFVLRILIDLLRENDKQQIMILAHNRCLLKYFYDAIVHREIATCGYYVGGMKEEALKKTESKQIVIATYSMAAEALDIKTLTTLIMATPKTDITQSVGRILRERHSQPIVVDIIDKHACFKNQWQKRKTFYRKEDYKIIYCTSTEYTADTTGWKVVYNPTMSNKGDCSNKVYNEEREKEDATELTGKCLIKLKK